MAIRPSKLHRYPQDWLALSRAIRFERAQGRCECQGECGVDHEGRCPERHGKQATWRQRPFRVILSTAHMDHLPEHNSPHNLRAMCQRCHLLYDANYHRKNWHRLRRRRLEEAGQLVLLETEPQRLIQLSLPADPRGGGLV